MRGDLAQAVPGGSAELPGAPGSSAGDTWPETSSSFYENRGFQLRGPQLFEIIENRGQSLLSDRAKSSIGYQSLELKIST